MVKMNQSDPNITPHEGAHVHAHQFERGGRAGEFHKNTAIDSRTVKGGARRTRVRRRRRSVCRPRMLRALAIASVAIVCLIAFIAIRTYTAITEYRATVTGLAAIQSVANRDVIKLTPGDLDQVQFDLYDLQVHLTKLDGAVSIPVGGPVIARLPWIGTRYMSSTNLIEMARILTEAGASFAGVGRDTIAAFDATGISGRGTESTSPTWSDVLSRDQPQLTTFAAQLRQIKDLRTRIAVDVLPGRVRSRIAMLDSLLASVNFERLLTTDFAAMEAALGQDAPVRYLVLLQNSAELRPGGGFPGTMALVTLDHGRITSNQIFDSYALKPAYLSGRHEKARQPWAMQKYFPQDGLMIHDASWWADFTRDGAQIMAMYAETGWPPIDGVIAVEPSVISDLLRATGPITITVDEQQRLITADNLLDEIERQRANFDPSRPGTGHKAVEEEIGSLLIDRLTGGNRSMLIPVLKHLPAAADRRDIQIYTANSAVEAALDGHHWSGRVVPDPKVPTLAVTFGNTISDKASPRMQPRINLTIEPPENGRSQATLTIDLLNTGSADENPFYAGFQRWYVDVALPGGSTRLAATPDPTADPESPSGGSYVIELNPKQTGRITIRFSMPVVDQLLIRRQSGAPTSTWTILGPSCAAPRAFAVMTDVAIDNDGRCSAP